MGRPEKFIEVIRAEFPEDRLTFQKGIATFHPENADDASRLFKLARSHRQPLYITGFGNNIDPLGEPFTEMVVVRTDRLNDLLDSSEQNLFVKVGAGYPLRETNIDIKEQNLYLPMARLPYVGSAGGAVAVNLTGDLRGHPVSMKKFLIQAEIVTADGEIITPGSVCFKSVSGYDIVKIFAPSWGLLGLLVSLTFRVIPITGAPEYDDLRMQAIDRNHFLSGLDDTSTEPDVVYSRKIKEKFDPDDILPIIKSA